MPQIVEVIEDPERAQVLFSRARLQLLEQLGEPSSAANLARRLGLPRQRVNYHLRELEDKQLVEVVEEKRKGSCVERTYCRTGRAYAISAAALGELALKPESVRDRFSSAYQIALASRAIQELGKLRVKARAANKKLPTFALEVDVRFADAAARNAFAEELAEAVAGLVIKHHDQKAPRGRPFRFYLGAYPRPAGAPSPEKDVPSTAPSIEGEEELGS